MISKALVNSRCSGHIVPIAGAQGRLELDETPLVHRKRGFSLLNIAA